MNTRSSPSANGVRSVPTIVIIRTLFPLLRCVHPDARRDPGSYNDVLSRYTKGMFTRKTVHGNRRSLTGGRCCTKESAAVPRVLWVFDVHRPWARSLLKRELASEIGCAF